MRLTGKKVRILIVISAGLIFCLKLFSSIWSYDHEEEIRRMILEDIQQGLNPSGQACVHPQLDIWNPRLRQYFTEESPLSCSTEENWVFVDNGNFRISTKAREKHGEISCDYSPFTFEDDFRVSKMDTVIGKRDGTPLSSDFFTVSCTAKDGANYMNVHTGVSYAKGIYERLANSTMPSDAMGLNILIFGFDSVSRLTWMRNLPKTHQYFTEQLGGIVLEGYNIVGDGTPQALLPILTGKSEPELPEARRGYKGAKPIDGHPWIWKDLSNAGYVTQYGEDSASIGTFQYRMLGFNNQPVDHYMRTFYLVAEGMYRELKEYCLGSIPRHLNMMNYMLDFVEMYKAKPKFSFLFHSEYSHESISKLNVADKDTRRLIEKLEEGNHLNNTILILMSDHGARFKQIRDTVQGKYEERMPYMGIRLSPWFKEKYPEIVKNLNINSRRLTTPFDLHATFKHMLDYQGSEPGVSTQRGISLFDEVPMGRTCKDAGIDTHWCACLNWKPAAINDTNVKTSARALIRSINKLSEPHRDLCEELKVVEVTSASRFTPKRTMLAFKRSKDIDGRIPDFSDKTEPPDMFYQITIITVPGHGKYEATVRLNAYTNKAAVNVKDISRINRYGNQPNCIASQLPHLRKYCYCKHQL